MTMPGPARRVLVFFNDDGAEDHYRIPEFRVGVFGKMHNGFSMRPQDLRRYRRHRQRCAPLNLRWPEAHPFGFPTVPVGAPLPRPWKIPR